MRPLVALLPAALAAMMAACAGGEPDPGEQHPGPAPAPELRAGVEVAVEHVLLITVDTLRADALGFAGEARVETPVLDRLAAAGWVFDRAHAHNVVTLPSHANILTGLYPHQHGVRDNSGFVLPEAIPTAATLLRDAGFATAAVIGAFPLDARFGLARGFDLYDDEVPRGGGRAEFVLAERRGDEVVERGLAWWQEHSGHRRFLWLHLFDPHAPYAPPEPFAGRYREHPYLGEVAAVDRFLAPLLERFLGGREPPTLILFTSDHGEALGEHGELTHGLFAYEATLRVPLVLWAPRLEPRRTAEPARHVDLLPTLLDAAGVAPPAGLPGRSLLRPPAGGGVTTYFEALTAYLNRGWAPLRGVIAGGDKAISLPLPELYDLDADPREEHNLFAAERRRWRAVVDRLPAESVWPPERGRIGAREEAALRSLGYLVGAAPARQAFTAADDPKSLVEVDRRIHRFIDLFQRRELEEATRVARWVAEAQPEMPAAHYHLGQVLLERGRRQEALAVMEGALRRGVSSEALMRQVALLLAEAGRGADAVALLEPLAPAGDPDNLNALAVAYSEVGRQAEARRALERALERAPGDPMALQNLALVALRGADWQQAERWAGRALARDGELPLAWNYLGVARYNLGRPGEALEAWERALELAPASFDVAFNLALVAGEAGAPHRARRALERYLAAAPREGRDEERARARALLDQQPPARP